MSTVAGVSDEFETYVSAAGAAFAHQLRKELGQWLPALDPAELGKWAAESVLADTSVPGARQRHFVDEPPTNYMD